MSSRRILSTLSLLLLASLHLGPAAHAAKFIPTASSGGTMSTQVSACLNCEIVNEENVTSDDLDAFATMSFPASVNGSQSISVDYGQRFTRGTKPGFVIGRSGALDVSVLEGLRLTTYLDGSERESVVGSDLITLQVFGGGVGRVWFRASKTYDEVRITAEGLASVSRELDVYHALAILRNGRIVSDVPKASEGVTASPSVSATCEALPFCGVTNAEAVISDDRTAFATMETTIGLVSETAIDLHFPEVQAEKSKAGFVVRAENGLSDVDLLDALTITTYLDGVEQQSGTGDDLDVADRGATKKLVLIRANEDFDQLRISLNALLTYDVEVRVYYGNVRYIDRSRSGGLVAHEVPGEARATTAGPLAMDAPRPNPSASGARLALRSAQPQHVTVHVYDARGREVAAPFRGLLDGEADVQVERAGLPAGAYLVRAVGETGAVTQAMTIVR